ncbi:MAG: hypothetical protein AAB276_01145 [Pseudomonadota bacterium]
MLSTPSLNSIFAGSVFAILSSGVYAAERPVQESEYGLARKAICAQNKIYFSAPTESKACETFLDGHRNTDNEKRAVIKAVCFDRHKTRKTENYRSCKRDFYAQYEMAPATKGASVGNAVAANNAGSGPTVLGSCAKGAAVSVVTNVFITAIAAGADLFLGCAGACSIAAAHYTIPSTVVQAGVGCAGGVALHAVEAVAGEPSNRTQRPQMAPYHR